MPSEEGAGAFLLAAGFGTRLRPLTNWRPKPLLPVCGVPVLDQALVLCRQHGVERVIVNAHHLADRVLAWAAARQDPRVQVQVELPEILGTGGGLRLAMPDLADPFIVVNGDILCDANLADLRRCCQQPGRHAAMLLRQHPQAAAFGVVALDGEGRVVRLTSLAALPGGVPLGEHTHFTGIHAMSHAALSLVPEKGFSCVVRSAYQQLVPRGEVAGLLHGGAWVDVGNPHAYLEANLAVLDDTLTLPLDPWQHAAVALKADGARVGVPSQRIGLGPGARLNPPCWLGPGVVVGAGAQVGPHAVLGDGAHIGAGARLQRTVVWDGCQVEDGARLSDVVVYDGGVLPVVG